MALMRLIRVLYLALLGSIACQATSLSRATFGDPCDKGVRCDSRASLSCIENTCQCVKPEEMTFNPKKGKCMVLSGERCSYTAVEILMDQTQEKRWTERLDCVENAVCNNDGYCDCLSEFFEDAEGNCSPKRTHGQNCTKDDECRTDKHLTCDNGLCSCNQTEAVFDNTYQKCVARAGASCTKYEQCVRNAYCPRRRYGYYNGESYEKCTCDSQYKRSKNGLCLAKYGMECNIHSAPCSEEFSCTNGKCECHFPDHQQYNNSALECVSVVGGPCSEKIEGVVLDFPCVPNAVCKSQHGISECVCNDGYIESKNRKCSTKYGQNCGDTSSQTCDPVANLVCRNGKCACRDFQMYDSKSNKCTGLVGAKCSLRDTSFCVEGASCQSYRDSTLDAGVCRCIFPSVPDSSRKCTSLIVIEDSVDSLGINGTVESLEVDLLTDNDNNSL